MSTNNSNNHTFAFITVVLLLLGAVGYTIYTKSTANKIETTPEIAPANNSVAVMESETATDIALEPEQQADRQTTDVTGKVVSVNTNAENKTFIKIKSLTNQREYTLLTSLDPDLVDIRLGDIISFSDQLKKSSNQAYYFVNKVTDYQIVAKGDAVDTKVGTVTVADITPDMEGRDIVLSGVISELTTSKKGHSFFQVTDAGNSIDGVLFNSETNELAGRLTLLNQYNDTAKKVTLAGKVSVYKGKLQIIVAQVYN
jgi:hypothetical protein